MTGRHRRRVSKIMQAVKVMIILAALLFLIMGSAWIAMINIR